MGLISPSVHKQNGLFAPLKIFFDLHAQGPADAGSVPGHHFPAEIRHGHDLGTGDIVIAVGVHASHEAAADESYLQHRYFLPRILSIALDVL